MPLKGKQDENIKGAFGFHIVDVIGNLDIVYFNQSAMHASQNGFMFSDLFYEKPFYMWIIIAPHTY